MRKLRTIATVGVMSIAGLGLIGAGAHAVFTSTTASSQSITAGTMDVTLSTTCANATGNGSTSLTLAPLTGTGSDFGPTPCLITITNNSPFAISEVAIQLTDPNAYANAASLAMDSETYACFYSDGNILFNEPMSTVEGYGNAAALGSIGAGDTDSYTVAFYAGTDQNTGCGASFTGWQDTPYAGFPSAYWTQETYPQTPGTNASAATLNNDAQGGTVVPTMTFTYNG